MSTFVSKTPFLTLLLSLTLLGICSLHAHDLNTSYTEVEIEMADKSVRWSLRLDLADLNRIFALSPDDGKPTAHAALAARGDEIRRSMQQKFVLVIAGNHIEAESGSVAIEEDDAGNTFGRFRFGGHFSSKPWQVKIALSIFDDLSPLHKNLAKVTLGRDELRQAILTRGRNEETFHFGGGAAFLLAQIKDFLWLGIEHIFLGYDHILFLIGLMLIGGRLANMVKIVTSFTVAHSVTLILAALQVVSIPGRLVESAIALSIVYVAAENFFIKESDQRWLVTFAFGLMHGFGFANVLTELGLPAQGMVASLLAFNLGVEFGQVVIVLLILPLVHLALRTRWRKQFVYIASAFILLFGMAWFAERAFDFKIAIG